MRKYDRGFTILEVSMVTSLALVAAGVGIVQIKNSLTSVDANTSGTTVVNQLRYAREIAVNQRRNVNITFNNPNTIVIERQEPDATLTTIETKALPAGFSFALPAASIGDTPDGYGGNLPIDFSDGNNGTFLADGTFVNASGVVLSGTVFTRGSSDGTSRAVTLSGTNGIIRQYYIRNGAWIEKK